MSENLSTTLTTPFDRWITAWLAHQRALGRDYGNAEWVLGILRRFMSGIGVSDLDQKGSISGAIPFSIFRLLHAGLANSSSANFAFTGSERSLPASYRTPCTSPVYLLTAGL